MSGADLFYGLVVVVAIVAYVRWREGHRRPR